MLWAELVLSLESQELDKIERICNHTSISSKNGETGEEILWRRNLLDLASENTQKKALDLDHSSLQRLRDLCNALEDDIVSKETTTSRDIIHTYTNIVACLAPKAEEKSISITEFKRKG